MNTYESLDFVKYKYPISWVLTTKEEVLIKVNRLKTSTRPP